MSEEDEHKLIDLAERRRKSKRNANAHDEDEEKPSEIEQLAINAEMSVGELVNVLSRATGDDQEVIDSFEDDAEHPAGSAVRNFFIAFFYAVPAIAALIIGAAVGADFAGGFTWAAAPVIFLCVLFESIPVILMLATSRLISRVMSGVRKALGGAVVIGLLFIIVALGSAAAQWILFANADLTKTPVLIGAIVRTFALPLAEIAAAIALPILRKKNLDEHLAVLKKKNDAKITMNRVRIQNELDTINAAIKTKSDLQKEQDYQKKQDLANRLIDLVTGKIIKDAEKSLNDDQSQDYGNSYRRDSRR
ncbi:hypothetical protein KDAU_15690 [Dictyobacter aurantiacus]|uniref:Uncharacterized protein n=2 Tax=Dictyobacter aurantiacus TaxID=1936993 RepID=A0A401ZBI1_9CHLR|nr:hypothetical protein KDAU_15690 [Dictyobacter aurantiacus]